MPRQESDASEQTPWIPTIKRWARGWHRDLGALAVGLTLVYALSGLALNHIAQEWPDGGDHNYVPTTHEYQIDGLGDLPSTRAVVEAVLDTIDAQTPSENSGLDFAKSGPHEVVVSWQRNQVVIAIDTGIVIHHTYEPRWLLRVMNWLHVHRGKPHWNYIADTYAIILILLVLSSLFLFPKGRKGLVGRAGILMLIGIAAPVVYLLAVDSPASSLEPAKTAPESVERGVDATQEPAPEPNQKGKEVPENE